MGKIIKEFFKVESNIDLSSMSRDNVLKPKQPSFDPHLLFDFDSIERIELYPSVIPEERKGFHELSK